MLLGHTLLSLGERTGQAFAAWRIYLIRGRRLKDLRADVE
jgi:hypothetical protein